MQLRVLFRADGGPQIGDGHLMRCLALAQHLVDGGGVCRLLTNDLAARPVGDWQREAVEVDMWSGSPGDQIDAQATSVAAEKMQANFIVVDGYQFTPAFHDALRHGQTPSLRFDDTCESRSADIVVNQNPGAEQRCRDLQAERRLLGCDYVMLRRTLRATGTSPRKDVPHVLVTLGGYDPDQLALSIAAEIFGRTDRLTMTLVAAGGAPEFAAAEEWSRRYAGKVDVIAPGDIDAEMIRADLAICAGGTTSLELASLGIPMVIVIRADNQRPGAHVLEQIGCAAVAGEGRDGVAIAAQKAVQLLGDAPERARMGAQGRKLVDGRGVERVAAAMAACIQRYVT